GGGCRGDASGGGGPRQGNNGPADGEGEGQPPATRPSERIQQPLRAVTEDYFNLLGLAILEGREFRSTDKSQAPSVAIVNQAFRDRYFPKATAVGKKLWLNGRDRPSTDIVGVITNGRTDDLTRPPDPEVYLPLWQAQA